MLRLYDYLPSGNGYKVRLVLHRLGLPFELVELDIMKGETRTPAFLAKNANGRVPALQLEDGTVSGRIRRHPLLSGRGHALLPASRLGRAQALQWMFFEQYSHEPFIAVARFCRHLLPPGHPREAELPRLMERGNAALAVMERHLDGRAFFVGERCTIADIALYAYTHVADEGGFFLSSFPAVRAWLDRVAAEPGHVPIGQR